LGIRVSSFGVTSSLSTEVDKELLFIVTDDKIIVYDINILFLI
jgi:hypothetical protein